MTVPATLLALATFAGAHAVDFFELPPIAYSETASDDRLEKLRQKNAASEWAELSEEPLSFLRSVLAYLDIPESSSSSPKPACKSTPSPPPTPAPFTFPQTPTSVGFRAG